MVRGSNPLFFIPARHCNSCSRQSIGRCFQKGPSTEGPFFGFGDEERGNGFRSLVGMEPLVLGEEETVWLSWRFRGRVPPRYPFADRVREGAPLDIGP